LRAMPASVKRSVAAIGARHPGSRENHDSGTTPKKDYRPELSH
jgi:hypothetical protein